MNRRARITPENAHDTFTSLKGLMAPLELDEPEAGARQPVEVEMTRLRPNPEQPRKDGSSGFSTASLEELAENIRQHGILQPLLVKDTGRFYQIVAGERRYRAAQLLGLEKVPVRIIEPRDAQDELQIALAENLQRKNLDTLEEAQAFRTLIRRFGLSYRELARLAGRSVAHVHGRLQLLDYDDVREAIEQKKIGIADAIQLARVPDESQRRELLADIEAGTLRGVGLHRQVQVFLGELSPERAQEMARETTPTAAVQDLSTALQTVETLGDDLGDEDRRTLYTLAARAAEKLGLQLAAPPAPQQATPQAETPRTPAPMGVDARRAVSRTKDFRTVRGYTLVNLIRVYWMTMERRGYAFTPGDWTAAPGGEGSFLVRFSYKVDAEPRSMEWWYYPDGRVEPANQDAQQLTQ